MINSSNYLNHYKSDTAGDDKRVDVHLWSYNLQTMRKDGFCPFDNMTNLSVQIVLAFLIPN